MFDFFNYDFTFLEIAALFGVMATCQQHTFQVSTKHPERALEFFAWLKKQAAICNAGRGMAESAYCLVMAQKISTHRELARNVTRTCGMPWPLPNVWLGVSVENQQHAEERIPKLLRAPAAVRFLNMEPLLGPIDLDLGRCDTHDRDHIQDEICTECSADEFSGELSYGHWLNGVLGNGGIDWVVIGGDTGTGARPFDPEWARVTIKQCREAGVAVFMKQFGKLCKAGEFPGFQTWVNKARAWIGGTKAQCFDTKMRPMRIGGDMAMAEKDCTFPVSYYLPHKDGKGGDWSEWPEDLRVREFPAMRAR